MFNITSKAIAYLNDSFTNILIYDILSKFWTNVR